MAYLPLYPICPRCLKPCYAEEIVDDQCESCWADDYNEVRPPTREDAKETNYFFNAERLTEGGWWQE